jgi:3-oxoadipate enol-lactonase
MRIHVPGLTLAYDEAGSGGGLLLVHGFPLSRQMWQQQLDTLGDAGRVIAPDLRGHGETGAATPGPYPMELLADDCAALLDALPVSGPVVIGGLSMGGYVALAFCRRYPERVRGLILAATRAGPDSPEGRANRDRMAAAVRARGTAAAVEENLPKMLAPETYVEKPDLVERVRQIMAATPPEGVVGALIGMRDRPDSVPLLETIQAPALVIHGLEDQLFPPAEAEAMHRRLPHSRLQLVPRAGHLLNMEQPEAFNAAVRGFLTTL